MPSDWVFVAIGMLLVVHLAVVIYAIRYGSQHTPAGTRAGAGSAQQAEPERTDDGIRCPTCGETNELEYKYCRQCVAELPTRVSFMNESSSSESRRTL